MKYSLFIKNLLELLVDDVAMTNLQQQLNYIEIGNIDYTSQGVFIRFKRITGIESFKFSKDDCVINGVIITSPQLRLGGEAILHISKNYIDYLEIYSYDGEYPKEELKTYTLKQVWQSSSMLEIHNNS